VYASISHSKKCTEEDIQLIPSRSLSHVNVVETSCRPGQGYPQMGFAILFEYSLRKKKAHRGASNTGISLPLSAYHSFISKRVWKLSSASCLQFVVAIYNCQRKPNGFIGFDT